MDWIIGSGIAAFSMYAIARWNPNLSERKKIELVMKGIDYRIKEKEPKLYKRIVGDSYTDYLFNVPYGLYDDPKLQPAIQKTLNKPTRVNFDGKLYIRIYHNHLNNIYRYSSFESKGNWTIPVGMSLDGIVYHDFDTIPHMTVAGATTWGKTVFMRMMMTHLIENNPDGVEFYILDLKGRLAFNKYRNLNQVKVVAGSYRECYEALSTVKKDIARDMKHLLSIGAENAKEGNIQTRKFIIVDEAGELEPNKYMSDGDKKYVRESRRILSHIARVAGQIGYKLIFGTQYPTAEILDSQIKANALAKVSFRLSTAVQSGVALDQKGAELLEYPGRAIYKTVDDHLVQTPFIDKNEIWERLRRYNVESDKKEDPTTREDIIEFG